SLSQSAKQSLSPHHRPLLDFHNFFSSRSSYLVGKYTYLHLICNNFNLTTGIKAKRASAGVPLHLLQCKCAHTIWWEKMKFPIDNLNTAAVAHLSIIYTFQLMHYHR